MPEENGESWHNVRKHLFLLVQKIQGKHRISTSATMVSLPLTWEVYGKMVITDKTERKVKNKKKHCFEETNGDKMPLLTWKLWLTTQGQNKCFFAQQWQYKYVCLSASYYFDFVHFQEIYFDPRRLRFDTYTSAFRDKTVPS